jgi:hypothetical protein
MKKFTKRAEFVLRFKNDIPLRRFTMKAGERWESALIDNHTYYEGCTAGQYLKAVRTGSDRFYMDRSPVLVSDVEVIGWVSYRRKNN